MRIRESTKSTDSKYTRWEQDNDLEPQPELGMFEEYLEMGKNRIM